MKVLGRGGDTHPLAPKGRGSVESLVELGQHVALARVLLSVDVASFDVIVSSEREHGEEDEGRMHDILSRTPADQEEVSV